MRYRINIPRLWLVHNYQYVDGTYGDINIVLKHFVPIDTARKFARKGPLIWDVSDDHFTNDVPVWGMPLSVYYAAMPTIATHVTCSTPLLAERIKQYTGVAATVISDPTEFIRHGPRIKGCKRLLWYGHQTNLQALLDLDLPKEYELRILTDVRDPALDRKGEVIPWSREQMNLGYQWCDVVIIPVKESGRGPRKDCKSPNRMTEAINAGRFVVANRIPAYDGYNMYLGDICEGLEWFKTHATLAMQSLIEAQAKVKARHHPSVIATQWANLFASILGVAANSGLDLSTSTTPEPGATSSPT